MGCETDTTKDGLLRLTERLLRNEYKALESAEEKSIAIASELFLSYNERLYTRQQGAQRETKLELENKV
jgi:hypothetical protein